MTTDKPAPLPHAKHAPHVVTVTDLDSDDELLEVPATAPEKPQEDETNKEPPREAPTAGETVEVEAGAEPKPEEKKKKKKRKSKNKKKPTGFEEFTAEGPLTKEQVEEELTLYDGSKAFHERIELCIQRYRAKRRWDTIRSYLFNAYLTLGGISTGQKMWQGMDTKAMLEMDASEIAAQTATDYINSATLDPEDWEVNFAYVVRGFLSWRVPYHLCHSGDADMVLAAKMIRNFLAYVVYHGVAPEYADNVRQAMEICEKAEKELVICSAVSNLLPGKFNSSCSAVYGGALADSADMGDWYVPPSGKSAKRAAEKISEERRHAEDMVKDGLRKVGSVEQQQVGLKAEFVKKEYLSLVVVGKVVPVVDVEKQGEGEFFHGQDTLGVLRLKPCVLEEDGVDMDEVEKPQDEIIEIWLEKEALELCFEGMFIETAVYRMSTGFNFIDTITGVFCSFFLRMENPDSKVSSEDFSDTESIASAPVAA